MVIPTKRSHTAVTTAAAWGTLGFGFCANSPESGKFTLETKLSAGVSAAGLGFRRPGCRRSSRRQRAKSHLLSSKFGQRDKVRASVLPGVTSIPELAVEPGTGERASTPAQVRSRRWRPAAKPLPTRPPPRRWVPGMGLTRRVASTTHPAQPRESEHFGNPLAVLAAAINTLLLPDPLKPILPASAQQTGREPSHHCRPTEWA